MRILIGCDTFAPDLNGSASFAKRLGAGLVERGHEVHIIAPAQPGEVGVFPEEHEGQTLIVHRVYSWPWPPHPWFRFMLPWRMKANARKAIAIAKPDVVHFQSNIVAGAGLVKAAKPAGIRVIGTNHTMPENLLQHVTMVPKFVRPALARFQWYLARRVFSRADLVTSPTQSSADYFEEMTGLSDVIAVSNGIDTTVYTPDFAPRSENRVVFVGRLDAEKHIDELIEAAAKLDPQLDVHVDIIGGGEQKHELQQLARDLGVDDRIAFHGKVTDEELRATLTRATVFAMPSRAELQCIAAMEAMASALPVVAANAMALPHLVHEGENGHLYEPGDIDALVAGLTDVLTASPAKLTKMKKASQTIVAKHSLAHTLDVFEALYRGDAAALEAADVAPGPRTRLARGGSSAG